MLDKKHMVKGFPRIEDSKQVYVDYMVGKQHREIITKKSDRRSTRRLELVHSTICGSINPLANKNERYMSAMFILIK